LVQAASFPAGLAVAPPPRPDPPPGKMAQLWRRMAAAALLLAPILPCRRLDLTGGPRPRRWMSSGAMLLGLATAEAQELEEMFAKTDRNGDGLIDLEEFMYGARDALDARGKTDHDFRDAVYDYLKAIFDASDVDDDGVLKQGELDFGSFLAREEARSAMAHVGNGPREDEMEFGKTKAKELHRGLDTDKDGMLNISEFVQAWRKTPAWPQRRVDDAIGELFLQADLDNNGFLNWQELRFAGFLISGTFAQDDTAAPSASGVDEQGIPQLGLNVGLADLCDMLHRSGGFSVTEIMGKDEADMGMPSAPMLRHSSSSRVVPAPAGRPWG